MDNDCDDKNGVCTNTNGSYVCSCKVGFRFSGNGFSCSGQSDCNTMCMWIIIRHFHIFVQTKFTTDIDECAESTDMCDPNAECTNTIGSYNCTCTVGYTGNGTSCGMEFALVPCIT